MTNFLTDTIFRHHLNIKKWSDHARFVCFDLQMRSAAQLRDIFGHRNFQNCSEPLSFLAFWLANALRATAACHFWTLELQKMLRTWGGLGIFTCKSASRHSGVPFFISLLNSYLRTRRFSEPTFRTSGTNHWRNTAIRDFPNIWRMCIFFLVTLLACWSSFFLLDFSGLLFSCPYCRKLDFWTSFEYILYIYIYLLDHSICSV